MTGDLTPECAAVVARVLDALGAPAGKDDDRTREQRYHDALAEAMRAGILHRDLGHIDDANDTGSIQAAAVAAGVPMGERGSAASAPGRMR